MCIRDRGWATFDLFGGGLISDLAKHGHLDSAQHNVALLQSQLRRFRTELADVGGAASGMQVSIDGLDVYKRQPSECSVPMNRLTNAAHMTPSTGTSP